MNTLGYSLKLFDFTWVEGGKVPINEAKYSQVSQRHCKHSDLSLDLSIHNRITRSIQVNLTVSFSPFFWLGNEESTLNTDFCLNFYCLIENVHFSHFCSVHCTISVL